MPSGNDEGSWLLGELGFILPLAGEGRGETLLFKKKPIFVLSVLKLRGEDAYG
jgi:hypothetical protein